LSTCCAGRNKRLTAVSWDSQTGLQIRGSFLSLAPGGLTPSGRAGFSSARAVRSKAPRTTVNPAIDSHKPFREAAALSQAAKPFLRNCWAGGWRAMSVLVALAVCVSGGCTTERTNVCDPRQSDHCNEGFVCDPQTFTCVAANESSTETPDATTDSGAAGASGETRDADVVSQTTRDADTFVSDAATDGGDSGFNEPDKDPLGVSCAADETCQSGFCIDGVCCGTRTCGTCETCGLGTGICAAVASGFEDPDSCVQGQICDGMGGCKQPQGSLCSADADCLTGHCTDGVCCESACDETCVACAAQTGVCTAVTSGAPDPGTCEQGKICDGGGACKIAQGNACELDDACLTGHCADGVCCESACDETCAACATGSGVCEALLSGIDPDARAPCDGVFRCQQSVETAGQSVCRKPNGIACDSDSECLQDCGSFYFDDDADGWGVGSALLRCWPPSGPPVPGFARVVGDCRDGDAAINPGVNTFQSAPAPSGGFDFDCSGVVVQEHPDKMFWSTRGFVNVLDTVPACGESRVREYFVDCSVAVTGNPMWEPCIDQCSFPGMIGGCTVPCDGCSATPGCTNTECTVSCDDVCDFTRFETTVTQRCL